VKLAQLRRVIRGVAPALFRVMIEVFQLDREQRRLKRIEAKIPSDALMKVPLLGAMVAKQSSSGGQVPIGCGQQTGVSESAQVLRRIKTERGEDSHRSGRAALVLGAERL